jgi:hypothetical protein
MVSLLFYYQLALLAIVWLFIMLHLTWPRPGVMAPAAPAEPEPITPKRPPLEPAQILRGPHAKASLCPM